MELFDETTFHEVAMHVFECMLETAVTPAEVAGPVEEPNDYIAQILLIGETERYITLTAPESTARQIASRMFGSDEAGISDADLRDALGEVTNMVGGCVKGAGDGSEKLSLPRVTLRSDADASLSTEATPGLTLLVAGQPLHFSWGTRVPVESTCEPMSQIFSNTEQLSHEVAT